MKNFNTIILALASLFLGIGIGTIIEYEPVNIKTEYKIELLDQTNVKISNGKEVKVIPFEEISEYIENDNL